MFSGFLADLLQDLFNFAFLFVSNEENITERLNSVVSCCYKSIIEQAAWHCLRGRKNSQYRIESYGRSGTDLLRGYAVLMCAHIMGRIYER